MLLLLRKCSQGLIPLITALKGGVLNPSARIIFLLAFALSFTSCDLYYPNGRFGSGGGSGGGGDGSGGGGTPPAPVAVTGVNLKTTTTIFVHGSETLVPAFVPANATNKGVSWTSDTPAVATVSAGGVVTAGSSTGTATITATTADGGYTATCAVTVGPAVFTTVQQVHDYLATTPVNTYSSPYSIKLNLTGASPTININLNRNIDLDLSGSSIGTLNQVATTSGNASRLKSVIMPPGITSIGSNAFLFCSGLTSVSIPSSVTSIGSSAFSESGLTSVSIPPSVTSIGSGAFLECSGLTSVSIPSSVTSIGVNAFKNSGLTSVTIPSSVASIESGAFYYCNGLTSVTFGGTISSTTGFLNSDSFPGNLRARFYATDTTNGTPGTYTTTNPGVGATWTP